MEIINRHAENFLGECADNSEFLKAFFKAGIVDKNGITAKGKKLDKTFVNYSGFY